MSDIDGANSSEVESEKEYKDLVEQWKAALQIANKKQSNWIDKGDKIVKRFRDERESGEGSAKKFNILWSNVETLKPAMINRIPKPVVTRRFRDRNPVGLAAARVMERALSFSVNDYDFQSVLLSCVEDHLLPGRGMAIAEYVPTYGPEEPETDENDLPVLDEKNNPKTFEPVVYEETRCKYKFWKDVTLGPGRCWEELPWVAYRNVMSKKKLIDRFGSVMAAKITLGFCPEDQKDKDQFKQAVIWEIWSKDDNEVIWISEYDDFLIERGEPPINFHGFFNTPKPIFSLNTNDNIIPVPDFVQYQDQANELDIITQRIHILVKALKVKGWYAGAAKDSIGQSLNTESENVLIPVDSWAMWAEKGGVKGMIDWFPIDQVINVVTQLYQVREQTKQELYEITGLSDIIRGASDPRETLGAQQLKGQFATMRVSDRQREIQRFARDLLRLKAEIIAEHFSEDTLRKMTGLEMPDELWAAVMEMLRDDATRSFNIDVETDSMLQSDENAEKEKRIEFLRAVGEFMGTAVETSQGNPALAKVYSELLMFTVRSFRVGRDLEQAFEEFVATMNQPPDPEEVAKQQRQQQLQEKQVVTEIQNVESDTLKNLAAAEEKKVKSIVYPIEKLMGGSDSNGAK